MMFNLHRSTLRSGLMGGAILIAVLGALAACGSKDAAPEENSGGVGGEPGEGGAAGSEEQPQGGTGGGGVSSEGGAGGTIVQPAQGGAGGAGSGGVAGSSGAPGGSGGVPVGAAGTTGATGCKTNKVCDDFESYAPGAFKSANGWTLKGSGLVVDESKAFSGKRSIKISVSAATSTGNQAMLGRVDKTVLSTGKSVYARMMVFLDDVPTGEAGLHWSFMRAIGFHSQAGKSALLTHSIGGQPRNLRNLMLWPTGMGTEGLQDCFKDDSKPIPVKQWVCVEWHLNPEAQAMEVWFDGKKQEANSWTTAPSGGGCANDYTGGKWIIPKLSIMDFGWQGYRNGTGGTLWVDDIAMDTARINCPAK